LKIGPQAAGFLLLTKRKQWSAYSSASSISIYHGGRLATLLSLSPLLPADYTASRTVAAAEAADAATVTRRMTVRRRMRNEWEFLGAQLLGRSGQICPPTAHYRSLFKSVLSLMIYRCQ